MTPSQIVVIGGSAGAIPSVLEIVRKLPSNFTPPLFVTIHFHPETQSRLPHLLEAASGIPSKHPEYKELIQPHHIYVAPPDWHMVIDQNHVLLHRGARENRTRPAIDPLFRSAAFAFGPHVTAILLSGYFDDGTAGLLAVKREGGRVIIQDPSDTPFGDMPANALEYVRADYVLPLNAICSTLVELIQNQQETDVEEPFVPTAAIEFTRDEIAMTNLNLQDHSVKNMEARLGKPSALTCPQCNGALWEIADGRFLRYRCHEGHAFSQNSLIAGQDEALETALWVALRALDEKIALHQRLLDRARELNQIVAVNKYQQVIDSTSAHALHIRQTLKRGFHSERRNMDPTN